MITAADVERVVERVVANHDPEEIYAFGSYAKGTLHEDSDLDLLVIVETELPPPLRGLDTYTLLAEMPFAIDLLFVTPAELAAQAEPPWTLLGSVMPSAVELYRRRPARV